MSNFIIIVAFDDTRLLYLFNQFMIGIIKQRDEGIVRGIVIGIWRFQLQITLGYSNKLQDIGEIGHA